MRYQVRDTLPSDRRGSVPTRQVSGMDKSPSTPFPVFNPPSPNTRPPLLEEVEYRFRR